MSRKANDEAYHVDRREMNEHVTQQFARSGLGRQYAKRMLAKKDL